MADTRVRIARLVEGPAAEVHRFSPFRPASGYVMVATFAGQSRFGLLAENLGHSGAHPATRIYEVILRPSDGGEPQSGGHFTPMPGGFANVGGALPHGDWLGAPDIDVYVVPLAGPGEEPPVLLHGRLQRVPLPLPRPNIPGTTPAPAAQDTAAPATAGEKPPTGPAPEAPVLAADTAIHPLNAAMYGLNSPDLNPHPESGLPWDAFVGMPAPAAATEGVRAAENASEREAEFTGAAAAEPAAATEPADPETLEPIETLTLQADLDRAESAALVPVMAGGQPETLAAEAVAAEAVAAEAAAPEAVAAEAVAAEAVAAEAVAAEAVAAEAAAPEAVAAEAAAPEAVAAEAVASEAQATASPETIAPTETATATGAAASQATEPPPVATETDAPADSSAPESQVEAPITDVSSAETPSTEPPPAPSPDAPLTGGTTHSLSVSVVLQPVDPRATRARGSVVLDYVSGGVLVTARGLGNPGALVGAGSQRLALYRIWLHSEKTGLYFPMGACQRISADTYRLETPSKVKLTQFERVLLSAEPEGTSPSRTGPSGPIMLAGTYRQ